MESSNLTNDVAPPAGETKNQANEMSDYVGDLFGEQVRVRWRISDFPSVFPPKEKGEHLRSPVFFSENGAWNLVMVLGEYYVEIRRQTSKRPCIGLYLCRVDSGPPKSMTFELALINEKGEKLLSQEMTSKFSNVNERKGWSRICDFPYHPYYPPPHNTLTVACTLGGAEEQLTDDSLLRRLWNLSLNWKKVFFSGGNPDQTLRLKDGVANAHGLIIRSRSVTLGRELRRPGEALSQAFEDTSKDSFNVVLYYIYCGHPQGLSTENVWEVYRLSHKYELGELTKCCKDFLLAYLSVDKVCNVIMNADLYQDKELLEGAKKYIAANWEKVLKTDQWKAFKEGRSKIAIEVLESSLNYEKISKTS